MTAPLRRRLTARPFATPPGPVSRASPLASPLDRGVDRRADGGRGRAQVRRVHGGLAENAALPLLDDAAVRAWWCALVTRRCGRREVAAVQFGAAFQTCCNWFDGAASPNARHLLTALVLWPEEFGMAAGPAAPGVATPGLAARLR